VSPRSGSPIIAENTPLGGDGAIPVWTCHACIDGNFLDPASKPLAQVGVEVVVSFVGCCHRVLDLLGVRLYALVILTIYYPRGFRGSRIQAIICLLGFLCLLCCHQLWGSPETPKPNQANKRNKLNKPNKHFYVGTNFLKV
jgi:hypothetical protein